MRLIFSLSGPLKFKCSLGGNPLFNYIKIKVHIFSSISYVYSDFSYSFKGKTKIDGVDFVLDRLFFLEPKQLTCFVFKHCL